MKAFAGYFLLVWCAAIGAAQASDCPKKIASIADLSISDYVVPVLQGIYRQIGCEVEIVVVPGRRGIAYFNKGLVDGEVFRSKITEKYYARAFVRSESPFLRLQNAIWGHTSQKIRKEKPVGYLIGVKWQEDFLATQTRFSNVVGFTTEKDLYYSLKRGGIGRFLSAVEKIEISIKADYFSENPVLLEILEQDKIYHYLDARFSPIMEKISQKIKEQQSLEVFK